MAKLVGSIKSLRRYGTRLSACSVTRVLGLRHISSIAPQSSSLPVFLPPRYFSEHSGTLNDHIPRPETFLICRHVSPRLWGARKKKTRRPDPEKSIGQSYGEKQGNLCWQAQGPAREAFCLMAPIIKKHLNNCSNVVPGADWITWSIYMIGKSESTAIPTIMFESFQKAPRKEAMEMVRKSGILKEYPGIETGHWSFPPNIIFPQQLNFTRSGDTLTPAEDRARGPQITVQNVSSGSFKYRKATIGVLIREQGSNY